MPGYPSGEGRMDLFSEAVASFVDDRLRVFNEQSGRWKILPNPQEGETTPEGAVRPFTWLLREIARTCTFFPKPIEIRKIYEEQFPPRDGRSASDLEGVLEG